MKVRALINEAIYELIVIIMIAIIIVVIIAKTCVVNKLFMYRCCRVDARCRHGCWQSGGVKMMIVFASMISIAAGIEF